MLLGVPLTCPGGGHTRCFGGGARFVLGGCIEGSTRGCLGERNGGGASPLPTSAVTGAGAPPLGVVPRAERRLLRLPDFAPAGGAVGNAGIPSVGP